ncbi:MAG: phage/plasmid primase, P4 family, partial [Methylococcaceae bacterium]
KKSNVRSVSGFFVDSSNASRSDWRPIPAHANAPEPHKAHIVRGKPEHIWCYKSAEGTPLGYVYRFKTSDGGKVMFPLSWCRHNKTGAEEWRWMAFAVPRWLYGLDRLAAKPDSPVLIVEGEKCADAAAEQLPNFACISWPGGSKAANKADWSPLAGRDVIIWPDCDSQKNKAGEYLPFFEQPGMKAANQIAEILLAMGCCVRMLDIAQPGKKKSGWDIVDAISDGLTGNKLEKYVRDNSRVLPVQTTSGENNNCVDQCPTDEHYFSVPAIPGIDARDGTLNTRPLSELGNACRLYDLHKNNIRYIPEVSGFLIWTDGAWHWDLDGAAVRALAAKLPRIIYAEGLEHLQDAAAFAKWSRESQKARTIKASVSLFQDFQKVRMPLAHIDNDAYVVGICKGTRVIDLRTGLDKQATQQDYVTKTLAVDYIGDSQKATRWLEFLGQIFNEDVDLIDWVHRYCGYALTGETSEEIFNFCYGLGANGKSVFGGTLKYIFGDYARVIAAETITEYRRQAGAATPDLAELIGARLCLSSETEDGAALAESLIKLLVSGDTITVRKLYGTPFEFKPQFKLTILGNHKPIIRGVDYGIWRRVRLIPFVRIFKPEERDHALGQKLKNEAPHILAWMLEGCLAWQKLGLSDIPASIEAATDKYQSEQDLIGQWITESCQLILGAETLTGALYSSYKVWCTENGLKPASNVALGRKLAERGFVSQKSNGLRSWQGIALVPVGGDDIFDYV